MTKTDFVSAVAEKAATSKKDAAKVVDAALDVLSDALAKGDKVTFVGFGTFETRQRAEREGRNPQDPSKPIKIPAKRVAAFKPGKELKEKVQ